MSWQTDLSLLSVKKLQKLDTLERLFPDCTGMDCIEIGAEKGVVTDFLRRRKGGRWIAGTLNEEWRRVAAELMKDAAVWVNPESLHFSNHTFDVVLASRPEHVRSDHRLFTESHRILKPGGRFYLLTPHHEPDLFLNRLKENVGLTLEQYDHFRPGYGSKEAEEKLAAAGFRVCRMESYCRFFSESIELFLNAIYALKSRKRARETGEAGLLEASYRPTTQGDLNRNKTLFHVYRKIFPTLKAISSLDRLIPFTRGYVLFAEAVKK